jgi:hypothetical protein
MRRAGKVVAWAAAIGVAGVGVVTTVAVVAIVLLIGSLSFEGCDLGIGDVGPGTGSDSQELAVDVEPADGLTDGATVFVTSGAFRGNGIIGVAVCLEEALTEEVGVDACDTDAGQRFATTAEGDLAAVVSVPRVITVDGEPHDCAERAGRCLVVAADSQDFDLSGGVPVTFAAGLGPADLVPGGDRPRSVLLPGSITPDGPVAAGTTVTAEASGFMPGEPVLVGRCTAAFLHREIWEACAPADGDITAAVSAIMGRSVDQVELHADADGAVRVEVEATADVAPGISGDEGSGADCTGEPGACGIVIAAAADTQRSAYLALTVSG